MAQAYCGLKPPRYPTLFETLVNAFACQQVTLSLGIQLLNRLAEACAPGLDGIDGRAFAFPGPANLAGRAPDELRASIAEAARVATAEAALFVFTFSRRTLPSSATPVAGESFVFTQFSGSPQVFLTEDQLIEELHTAGFVPDPALPLRELNVPAPGQVRSAGTPVIFEAGFRLS